MEAGETESKIHVLGAQGKGRRPRSWIPCGRSAAWGGRGESLQVDMRSR